MIARIEDATNLKATIDETTTEDEITETIEATMLKESDKVTLVETKMTETVTE